MKPHGVPASVLSPPVILTAAAPPDAGGTGVMLEPPDDTRMRPVHVRGGL